MNSLKAATAASHAYCIGSEMGFMAKSNGAPREILLRRIQGPLEVAEQFGAAALGEEPCAVSSSVTAARWHCTASILITRSRYTAVQRLR